MPITTLKNGLSCEYEIVVPETGAICGPELRLRRVLWVPVMVRRTLRGLVMQGTLQRKKHLLPAKSEKIADELGLLLELEEERKLAAARKADQDLWLRIKRLLAEQQSVNMILGQLAESCTRGEATGGAGAVFALIGEGKNGAALAGPPATKAVEHFVVRAQSGDTAWAYSVNGGPLESLWRQALENRRVAGMGADRQPLAKDISRIVAIPVTQGDKIAGVLLAGLPKARATIDTLDRLEWRGALAAEVLDQEQQGHAELRRLSRYAFVESSPEPAILVDGNGMVVRSSTGAEELLRGARGRFASSEEPVHFPELFVAAHREAVQAWIEQNVERISGKERKPLEVELKGSVHVALRKLPIATREFSAVTLERVETQRNGRPMTETFAALQQAIECLEEGVAVFDGRGEILARNAMFLRILGLGEEESKGLCTLRDFIQAAAKNAAEPERFAAAWRALAEDHAHEGQDEWEMARPVPQTIERYTRPIAGPSAASPGQKLGQSLGQSLSQPLGQPLTLSQPFGRVEVYRIASAWRSFQSRMARTETLASLGQRVTRIVHELNNPLTTILGNAQRMAQRDGGSSHAADAAQILREAERAAGIVRQLLNFPRETRAEMCWMSLNELVENTAELQKTSLAAKGLRIEIETEKNLPRVKGDFGQLQQVLLNLLENSQQAMQDSGKGSVLTLRTATARPGHVKLEVHDDGPGIPKALQPRIFDPFVTTKPPGKGTGLGLAIVSGFVRKHGGNISVDSLPGGGSRFVVELPAGKEAGEAPQREVSSNEASHNKPSHNKALHNQESRKQEHALAEPDHKALRVLVVEDEPTVAVLIADVVGEQGMEVDVFPDGQIALEATQKAIYDLAICDVNMPGMDGQDFFAALEQLHNPLSEHVLFVTGDAIGQRTHDFLERQHLPHVAKPFRVEELALAVREMLRRNVQAARS
ncbi:MAG: ATP-binding protein [Candidatus Acidiferrum sp.]